MKEKEEDEERNENICLQTIKQRILNSKTEAHSNPLWIVGGAGQLSDTEQKLKMTSPALTRLEHQRNRQQWDSFLQVVTKEFTNLETWVKDHVQKHLDELTKILRGDLSEAEFKWASEEQIEIIANLQETWQKKLSYIKYVLQKYKERSSELQSLKAKRMMT